MIETAWFLHDLVRRGRGILGVRAPVVIQYSKNLLAPPEVLDLRFLHDSRNIAPENCRKLRPKTVRSRPNLAIDRIDPGRVHTDQDLIAGRFGRRRLLIAKHRRPAKLMYSGGFHREFSTTNNMNIHEGGKEFLTADFADGARDKRNLFRAEAFSGSTS